MRTIKLEKGAVLKTTKSKSNVSYFYILFKGGAQSEKILQLSHLAEHVLTTFDIKENNITHKNDFVGRFHGDARTEEDFTRFQFFVTNEEELVEMLNKILLMINNVVITKVRLDKEKQTIINEVKTSERKKYSNKQVIDAMKKISIQDVKDYIGENLTANNLVIYAITNETTLNLKGILNNFVNQLKVSELNNSFERDDYIWHGDSTRIGFLELNKDLSVPANVSLIENQKKINENLITIKSQQEFQLIELQILKKIATDNYKQHALMQAFELFIADFQEGIKKKLRHELGLVYRTNHEYIVTPKKSLISNKIFTTPDNLEKVEHEMVLWFQTILENGLTEEQFKRLKNNYRYYALTRPNQKDEQFNFLFDRKQYIEYINSLSLVEYNKYLKQLLSKNLKKNSNLNI